MEHVTKACVSFDQRLFSNKRMVIIKKEKQVTKEIFKILFCHKHAYDYRQTKKQPGNSTV